MINEVFIALESYGMSGVSRATDDVPHRYTRHSLELPSELFCVALKSC